MYPYHNEIRKRIKSGELVGYKYVDNYKNIGECLLLLFDAPPFERPIRPHKYDEYVDILSEWSKNKRQTKQPRPKE
ncbi:MAG: hypothetical protein K2I14_05890 [Eubacterium sp.]|nr:hypothetical protein [Eubacterium sp.]